MVSYKDDDGEVTDISTESDLTEAIQYFQAGSDDPPLSSAASILSGRSFGGRRRITLRVHITVDYDGPSLSDTSSLVSLEEYKGRNKSNGELSWTEMGSIGEVQDNRSHTSSPFEHALSQSAQDRGAAWLRDQNARTIKAMLGATPEPSESDSQENIDGDLALQRDPRGKYYYSYTGGSCSTHDSGYEDWVSIKDGDGPSASSPAEHIRPNSMQLSWLASQQKVHDEVLATDSATSTSSSEQAPSSLNIPLEDIQFLPPAVPPPGTLTTCSECGVFLDAIRYVCAVCGEKEPVSNSVVANEPYLGAGKGKEKGSDAMHAYPPFAHQTSPLSSSLSPSSTLWSSSPPTHCEHPNNKSLPCPPSSSPTLYNAVPPSGSENPGYELCSGCIEAAGIYHALCTSTERVGSIGPGSTEDAMSLWIRSAPRHKGQIRHAYFEKVWGHQGWDDVGA